MRLYHARIHGEGESMTVHLREVRKEAQSRSDIVPCSGEEIADGDLALSCRCKGLNSASAGSDENFHHGIQWNGVPVDGYC